MATKAAGKPLAAAARCTILVGAILIGAVGVGCEAPSEQAVADPVASALVRLRAFEQAERAKSDFAKLPSSESVLGANPFRVTRVGSTYLGALRGSSQVVRLESHAASFREAQRMAAPRSTTGLAAHGRTLYAVGELSSDLMRYEIGRSGEIQHRDTMTIPGVVGLRDVAVGEGGEVFVAPTQSGSILRVDLDTAETTKVVPCRGPVRLEHSAGWLIASCLWDHAVRIVRADHTDLAVSVEHDGPIWSFALLRADDSELEILVGGVENRPLDRSENFFGHIDSFAFHYRVTRGSTQLLSSLNLSEHGVVTPKAMLRHGSNPQRTVLVTGYGGEHAVVLETQPTLAVQRQLAVPPGINDIVRAGTGWLAANPLLDSWLASNGELTPSTFRATANQPEVRLGEVLTFTTLMAPGNPTDGSHSSFTCETCHFEGGGDGRTHHTGRGEVHATTKPLFGLFNNKPHFTRALDRDLTRVAHAEFRIARMASGNDSWFTLDIAERPWLTNVTGYRGSIEPEALRRSLMRFLMAYTHRPNPYARARSSFGERERRGAALFRTRCASCHTARLIADDSSSVVPFEQWEALILSDNGPIVWARDGYRKTGIQPYVHPQGARPSSLRRAVNKRPYFTNGSAVSLDQVLERVAWDGLRFFHAAAPPSATQLCSEERDALLAFIRLL